MHLEAARSTGSQLRALFLTVAAAQAARPTFDPRPLLWPPAVLHHGESAVGRCGKTRRRAYASGVRAAAVAAAAATGLLLLLLLLPLHWSKQGRKAAGCYSVAAWCAGANARLNTSLACSCPLC